MHNGDAQTKASLPLVVLGQGTQSRFVITRGNVTLNLKPLNPLAAWLEMVCWGALMLEPFLAKVQASGFGISCRLFRGQANTVDDINPALP